MTKVLIVDDSSFARNHMRRILEGTGYEIFQADSGKTAIELVRSIQPDVVTLDLLMPDLSGKDTLIEMKKIYPVAQYIIVTADIQGTTHSELMELGADAFLNKPLQIEGFLRTIEELLQKGEK